MNTETIGVCEVEARRVYGRIFYYPLNKVSENFIKLFGNKTLNRIQLRQIRDCGLGIDIKYKNLDDELIPAPDNLGIDY